MTKPKFTPDPAPNIEGLPIEQQLQMVLDHRQRQLNRIEDWWPKDFENRVQALEGLVPYKIGPWVMVSLSSMDWVHDVVTGGTCGTAVGARADAGGTEEENLVNMYNIDYSVQSNVVIVSGAPVTAAGVSLRAFNLTTGARSYGLLNCTRSGHKIISTPGTSDEDLLVVIAWPSCVNDRWVRFYDISAGTLTFLNQYGLGTNNARIEAERNQDILLSGDFALGAGNQMRLVDKSTYAGSNVATPSGWTTNRSGVAATTSSTEYLICLNNSADDTVFRFFAYSGTGGDTISGPGVLLPDFGEAISVVDSRPVVVGSRIYWHITLINPSPYSTYFLETDLDGNTVSTISAYDTNNYINTSTSYGAISYSSEDNSLYYMYGDTIWRYYLTEGTYHQCTPGYDSSFTYDDVRERSVVHYNGSAWTVVKEIDTNTGWMLEKSPVSFA